MAESAIPLSRLARSLRVAAAAMAAVLPLIVMVAIVLGKARGFFSTIITVGALPFGVGAAIAMIYALLVSRALTELCRMLRLVEGGDAFSPDAILYFRRFASWLLGAAVAAIILPPIAAFLCALFTGARGVTLDFEGADVLFLLLSALLVLIARLFEAAARYREDSRAIV